MWHRRTSLSSHCPGHGRDSVGPTWDLHHLPPTEGQRSISQCWITEQKALSCSLFPAGIGDPWKGLRALNSEIGALCNDGMWTRWDVELESKLGIAVGRQDYQGSWRSLSSFISLANAQQNTPYYTVQLHIQYTHYAVP